MRTRPADIEAWSCFQRAAQSRDALDEAVRRLERYIASGAGARADGARFALGGIEMVRGADRAEHLLKASLEGFRRAGNRVSEVVALLTLANFHASRGRLKETEELATEAAAAATASGDPALQTRVRLMEGYIARRKGDYGRAWLILRELEPEIFLNGPGWLQALWLDSMAYVSWATGRPTEALAFYQREAEALHRDGNLIRESAVRGDIVFMAGQTGVPRAERLALAREALEAAVSAGNRSAEGRAHYFLAENTNGGEALDHARQGLAISRQTRDYTDLQMTLRATAHLSWHVDRDEEGYRLIAESLTLARERGNLDDVARAHVIQARMRWEHGRRDEAIRDSLAALDAAEATRDLQPDSLTRARRFSQWGRPYLELTGHLFAGDLLARGETPSDADLELAFATSERMRARMLLDELDAARSTSLLLLPGPLEKKHDEMLQDISKIQRRLLDPALAPDARLEVLKTLTAAELQESLLRREIEKTNPAFAALRRPVYPTLREIRARLADDEALLVYQASAETQDDGWVFAGGSWLAVVTRDGVRLHRLVDVETVENRVSLFLGLCEGREGDEKAGAARLYRDLLEAGTAKLSPRIRRLVIVPHRSLMSLPFGALRPSPSEAPIGEHYEIATAPSATLWYRWKAGETRLAESPALALADPALPGTSTAASSRSPERAWALTTAATFPPLRAARDEGRSIVRRLGAGSRLLVGSEASEAFVKKENLSKYRVVHFATHALLDDEHPERTAVLLSPGNDKEDGLLQLREIVKLDLKGRLVVLSGCRSASGLEVSGEGVVGLARAFFQAGATTVVGSLWPLRDDDAAAFFDRFYRHLANGRSVGGAVREAQRDRIRAGAPTASWAGIVTLGDGGSVPFPHGARPWPWVVAVSVLAAAGFAAFRYRAGR
ncbi:MAG: CHAT domain-containing protein [Acidobacteriota bacterium]